MGPPHPGLVLRVRRGHRQPHTPDKCPACGSSQLTRRPTGWDTWFSSALWPFSTMGWPDRTPELAKFYPTSCLVTGFDILFFWVARMMMMGLEFMGEVPFTDVYIHALVRDAEGQKMSKSKGNVIDPLTVMDKFGTDAFRFTLAAVAAQGRDIKMSEERVAGYRNFVNKIWNAARFTLMNLGEGKPGDLPSEPTLEDRWILSRVNRVAQEVGGPSRSTASTRRPTRPISSCGTSSATGTWSWPRGPCTTRATASARRPAGRCWPRYSPAAAGAAPLHALCHRGAVAAPARGLRQHHDRSLAGGHETDLQAEHDMGLVMEVIGAVRNIRGEMGISPGLAVRWYFAPHRSAHSGAPGPGRAHREPGQDPAPGLGRRESAPPSRPARPCPRSRCSCPWRPGGLLGRGGPPGKGIGQAGQGDNPEPQKAGQSRFLAKAPDEVVAKEKAKVAEAEDKIIRVKQNLERVRSFR